MVKLYEKGHFPLAFYIDYKDLKKMRQGKFVSEIPVIYFT
jgi:hypothetical protein